MKLSCFFLAFSVLVKRGLILLLMRLTWQQWAEVVAVDLSANSKLTFAGMDGINQRQSERNYSNLKSDQT